MSISVTEIRGNRPAGMQILCHRVLFPRKRYRFYRFGRSSGLLSSTPSSHAPMAAYSDVSDWASANELTAAGLRRTLTCFPFHTPQGDQIGCKSTK